MKTLDRFRDYHNNAENFTDIHINATVIPVEAFLALERYYAKYLKLMITFFPYVLPTQFGELMGLKKTTTYAHVNRLKELKLITETELKNVKVIFPSSRTLKWEKYHDQRKQEENNSPNQFKKVGEETLYESLLKCEYLLQTDTLLLPNCAPFLSGKLEPTFNIGSLTMLMTEKIKNDYISQCYNNTKEKIESLCENDVIVYAKGKLSQEEFSKLMNKNKFNISQFITIISNELINLKDSSQHQQEAGLTLSNMDDQEKILFLIEKINNLTNRGCYLKTIALKDDKPQFQFVVIHSVRTTNRYEKLIKEIITIISTITDATFSLEVITANEDDEQRVRNFFYLDLISPTKKEQSIKVSHKRKQNKKKLWSSYGGYLKETDVKVFNTNLDRHFILKHSKLNPDQFEEKINVEFFVK